jgi:glutamine synthetase
VLAAALATGLYGIEQKLELPAVTGNAYENPGVGAPGLPTSLAEATQRFLQSKLTRQLFGESFVTHFSQTRMWEERAARRYVSDFDLARYFEII